MHPPRPKRTSESQGVADRLVDWLLSHCPFCTLLVLSFIVIGPTIQPIPDPTVVVVAVVLADIAFMIMRRLVVHHSHHRVGIK